MSQTIEQVIESLSREVESAIEEKSRPKGGMRVPFFGDFASAPPSTLYRLQWWVRVLRESVKP